MTTAVQNHGYDVVYRLGSGRFFVRCDCGWFTDWYDSHDDAVFAAEQHILKVPQRLTWVPIGGDYFARGQALPVSEEYRGGTKSEPRCSEMLA